MFGVAPFGKLPFGAAASVSTTVTLSPGAGAVLATGSQPTVTLGGAPITLTPGAGAILATGSQPTVTLGGAPITLTPGAGAVLATGNQPTVTIYSGVLLMPGAGAILATGSQPTITISTQGAVQIIASPFYDPCDALPPGFILQREFEDALALAWVANGFQPLTLAQAIAACGTPPVAPTSLKDPRAWTKETV